MSNLENTRNLETINQGLYFDKSKKELSAYWLGVQDVLSSIKSAYNLENKMSFDEKFVKFLMEYQRFSNLSVTWVLDLPTISKMEKDIPWIFDWNQKVKETIFRFDKGLPIDAKSEVLNNVGKQLSEESLIASTIWPKDEILKRAKKVLSLEWNPDEMKKQIKAFQEKQNLWVDWIIWKQTYAEILAFDYFSDKKFEEMTKNITEQDKKEILHFLENGKISSLMWIKIKWFLDWLKRDKGANSDFKEKYWIFYEKYETNLVEYNKTPEAKVEQRHAEKTTESLYARFKRWDDPIDILQDVATNPTVIFWVWLAFLFGMFWNNSKFTDSWWKRLGILFLWPVVWEYVGWNEVIADLKKGVKWVGENSESKRPEWRKDTENFFKQTPTWFKEAKTTVSTSVSKATDQVVDWAWDLWDNISKSVNATITSIKAKNDEYLKAENEKQKELYVKEFDLFSTEIYTDKNFSFAQVSKLEEAKWDFSKIYSLLSPETQNKLFPQWYNKQREVDLVNYVNLLLSRKENSDLQIKDLYVDEKTFIDHLKEKAAEVELKKFSNDEEVNEKMFEILKTLSPRIQKEVSSLSDNLVTPSLSYAERIKKIDDLLKYPNLEENDKKGLKMLKSSFFLMNIYNEKTKKLEAINIANLTNDEQRREKIQELEKLKLETEEEVVLVENQEEKISKKLKDNFESKVSAKINEINKSLLNRTEYETEILAVLEDKQIFNEAKEKIWTLKWDDISSLEKYFSTETAVAFAQALRIFNEFDQNHSLYNKTVSKGQNAWFEVYTAEEWNFTEEEKIAQQILIEWSKVREKFIELKEKISQQEKNIVSEINTLEHNILDLKRDNLKLFEAKKDEYQAKIDTILKKVGYSKDGNYFKTFEENFKYSSDENFRYSSKDITDKLNELSNLLDRIETIPENLYKNYVELWEKLPSWLTKNSLRIESTSTKQEVIEKYLNIKATLDGLLNSYENQINDINITTEEKNKIVEAYENILNFREFFIKNFTN